jgi:transcriptional regulator with XRE-family HTH domain
VTIGRAVAVCRATKGWTQGELGERSGLTSSALSLVEAGRRDLSLEALGRLSAALGLPVYLLMLLASTPAEIEAAPAEACLGLLYWFLDSKTSPAA